MQRVCSGLPEGHFENYVGRVDQSGFVVGSLEVRGKNSVKANGVSHQVTVRDIRI